MGDGPALSRHPITAFNRSGGAAPPIRRIRRDRGVEHQAPSRTSPQEQTTLPDYVKGGELVLKLFAFTQALVASARRDEGQTMAEYGVVLAVITLAVIAAISLLSENVRNAIESVANIL
jgi:Flp pilus assembly pilin Flp